MALIHRALDAITNNRTMDENAALLLIAALVIAAGCAGWLD